LIEGLEGFEEVEFGVRGGFLLDIHIKLDYKFLKREDIIINELKL